MWQIGTEGRVVRLSALSIGERGRSSRRIAIRIDNLEHISAAYGRAAAQCAQEAVIGVVRSVFGRDTLLRSRRAGWLSVELVGADGTTVLSGLLQSVRAAIDRQAVRCDAGTFHLAASVIDPDAADASDARDVRGACEVMLSSGYPDPMEKGVAGVDDWRVRYRHDMAEVCTLFSAIAENRVQTSAMSCR